MVIRKGAGSRLELRDFVLRRGALVCPVAAMSFCSFFGGEVFQNHFEPGTACGIKAGIAFWMVVESPSQDGATVAAEEKRAWERRTKRRGWRGLEQEDLRGEGTF